MKSPSPLLGFNNNVRHKGRVFHIQTEDSGVKHPHIITHLFADGGRILKTTKTSYSEHLGEATMAEKVRAMMQDQHKAMFISLRDGMFDHLLDGAAADKPSTPGAPVMPPPTGPHSTAPATSPPTARPSTISPASAPSGAPPALAAAAAPTTAAAAPPPAPPTAAASEMTPKAPGTQRSASRPAVPVSPEAILGSLKRSASPAETAPTARFESSPPPIDLDALERAAEELQSPFIQQIQDLPPPPAAVLNKRPSARPGPASEPPELGARSPGPYAQSRPTSIFGTTRPTEGMSIFGEDLISEKSLDEVILSYLAEDLESPEKK